MVKEVSLKGYQCERDGCEMLFTPNDALGWTEKVVKDEAKFHESIDSEHLNLNYDFPNKIFQVVLLEMDGVKVLGEYDQRATAEKAELEFREKFRMEEK